MKALLLIATVFVSAKAMALGPNSTWAQIFASRSAFVNVPYDNVMGIALDNACMTATTIETIKNVPVCVKTVVVEVKVPDGGTYNEYSCVEYANQKVANARTYQHKYNDCPAPRGEQEPDPSQCVPRVDTITTPQTVTAEVTENHGEATTQFFKEFTFPACN